MKSYSLIFLLLLISITISLTQGCSDSWSRKRCRRSRFKCKRNTTVRKNCQKTCDACDAPAVTTSQPSSWLPPTGKPGVCGQPQIQGKKVIAGVDAVAGSWPWQVLMLQKNRPMCGGSLVSPTWVVTAAHCVFKYANRPSQFAIRVGEHDTSKKEGFEVDHKVKKIIVYPKWDPAFLDGDIALLQLETPAKFNSHVAPVCLPKQKPSKGMPCYLTGWGKKVYPGSMTNILQQAKMPVVTDNRVCYIKNSGEIKGVDITERMICAGDGGKTQRSGCHGDSGGPLVCLRNGLWELHGAVSHGSSDCSARKTYTVFARVSYFKTWIEQTMAKN